MTFPTLHWRNLIFSFSASLSPSHLIISLFFVSQPLHLPILPPLQNKYIKGWTRGRVVWAQHYRGRPSWSEKVIWSFIITPQTASQRKSRPAASALWLLFHTLTIRRAVDSWERAAVRTGGVTSWYLCVFILRFPVRHRNGRSKWIVPSLMVLLFGVFFFNFMGSVIICFGLCSGASRALL